VKVTYFIDKPRRLIITRAKGSVMFDDIRNHQDRLLADPDFDLSFDQLGKGFALDIPSGYRSQKSGARIARV